MRRNLIELRHLRYFAAVAEAGSITRAADRLRVAQPAVSQQIRAFEEVLGVTLLVRQSRGVTLTPEGKRVLASCAEVFQSLDRLADDLAPSELEEVEVSLGLPMTVSPHLTRPLLSTMRRDHPQVRLQISEGMSSFLAEWLLEDRLDAAILFLNQMHGEIEREEIVSEQLYVVGPKGAFRPGDCVPLSELHRFPLIVPNEQHALHQLVRDATQSRGFGYTVRFEMDVVSELKRFVEQGEGFAVLAPIGFHDGLMAGRLSAATIIDPHVYRTWTWTTRKGRALSPACKLAKQASIAILRERTRLIGEAVERAAIPLQ